MNGRNVLIGIIVSLLVAGAFFMNADKKDASPPPAQSNGDEPIETAKINEPMEKTVKDKPQEGSAAKDFELKTLTGETLRLHENGGKPTLINFWASWCPPCKVEMPHLQKAYETYGDKVNFLMVDLLFNDSLDNVTEFVNSNEYTFPVLFDETGDIMMDYQVAVIPTTYIVDKNGVISHKVMGPMTMDRINEIMEKTTD